MCVFLTSYEKLRKDEEIISYINAANNVLGALGFTEHGLAHAAKTGEDASRILKILGYDERTCELAKIAGLLHDIGNTVNRCDHAQSGAFLAFELLRARDFPVSEVTAIVTAIGHHDEKTAAAVSPLAAALILADKSDVRNSRVRNKKTVQSDIHDRVNYSVTKSELKINEAHTLIKLKLTVDTHMGSVMDYFEIFMARMILCRKAAERLGLQFKLMINEQQLI